MGFYCRECGKTSEAYAPKCPGCGAGNALVQGTARDGGWVRASGGAVQLKDIERRDVDRITTGTRELDRVLAGGFGIEGTYILSGSPGAGKSTLALQIAIELADAEVGPGDKPYVILYVAAEETKEQIAGRADRLLPECRSKNLAIHLVNETDVLEIEKLMVRLDPDVVVADSAQTLVMGGIEAVAGSVNAIKAVGTYLCGVSKARRSCLIMISHVTKDEDLAGPKMFEHLVDGVMHLANEEPFRVLRMSKHRFGPTSEIGIFRMAQSGLRSVENPSELLLESHVDGVSGSVVAVMSDSDKEGGARALLCEIQGLFVPTAMGGIRQAVTGLDQARVRQVGAVLAGRLEGAVARLQGEMFVSLAGGLRSKDAGLDLPIALAMLSAVLDEEMPEGFCCFGELGLAGEIRPPRNVEGRVKGALAMHMESLMSPPLPADECPPEGEIEYIIVRTLAEAVDWLGWDIAPKRAKKARRKKCP